MPQEEPKETDLPVPKDKEIRASSPTRDGEVDPALQPSSAEEFADSVTCDLGPPSTMGKVEDFEDET